ncbi:hypothetical protein PPYR_12537 [Photinus pyralis]|uniref:Protein sleepless n=1 Tax=Photinus pyralis TaxID=7054 RepID=A0A5N4A6G8_PHOPY|nr:hypothetical protein PPYR_12537 [Photinus pyralis]
MESSLFFAVVVVGSVLLPLAQSFRCYNCSSVQQKHCGYEFNNTNIKLVDCQTPKTCKKVLLPTVGGGYEPIQRGCLDNELCTPLSVCLSCESDMCNSASNFRITLLIVVLSLINLFYC